MSANPNYDISNQYIPDSYDEDVVFDRIAKSFSEIIAKELDPDGTNPSLADDIKANIDSDPTFFENLSKSVFDGDEDATKDVVESLSNAAAVTAAAIPETLKQVIKNSAEKVRASAQAANDNLPTWFKNYVDDAVTNGNKLASEFGKKMGLLAAAIAVDKILDSNFAATEIFKQYVVNIGAILGAAAIASAIASIPFVSTLAAAAIGAVTMAIFAERIANGMIEAIKDIGHATGDVIVIFTDAIAASLDEAVELAQKIGKAISEGIDTIVDTAVATAEKIAEAINDGIEAGKDLLDAISDAVSDVAKEIEDILKEAIDDAVAAGEVLAETAEKAVEALAKALSDLASDLAQTASEAYDAAVAAGASASDAVAAAAQAMADGFSDFMGQLGDFFSNAFDAAMDFGVLAAEAVASAMAALNQFLDDTAEAIGEAVEAAGEWIGGVLDALWEAIFTGSPLTLDLDGDGVELVSLANSNIYWDIDEDGFAEHSGWVAADDGLLAIDLDGDGAISKHTELFGSIAEDGFTALSVYDTNSDGIIDANDAQFSELLVWQDVNQNGISEATELYTLADLDIVSIDLNATTPHNMYIEGHNISHVSSYTVDDGVSGAQTFDIVDVWFEFDNVNTNYVEDYTLDLASLFVTTIRGYGVLPDLHVAASIDNDTANPDSLMSLLQDFNTTDFSQAFADDRSVMDTVRDIMFRWAGVDDLDPTSRGQWVDARELEFLEALTGEGFIQSYGNTPNPGSLSAQAVHRAFETALYPITAKLIAQTAGASLFNDEVFYNPLTDTFDGFTDFNQDTLDSLLATSIDGNVVTDKTTFWVNVVNMINHSVGVDNLSTSATAALEAALQASDSSLTVALILEKITKNIDDNLDWTPAGDYVSGTSADEVYDGSIGDDTLKGGYGDDTLNGGIGNDKLYGGNGHDLLNGQLGDDYLKGDGGDDIYLFSIGHGNDTIADSGGTDKIVFEEGITLADLTIIRTGSYDVSITFDQGVGAGSIIINKQVSSSGGAINTLEFHDNTVFDLNTMDYTYTGDATDEIIRGVRVGFGGTGVDTIYGMDGDDTIYGYMTSYSYTAENYLYGGNGNDTIFGDRSNEELYGEAGDDYLAGNQGDDQLTGGLGDDFIKGDAGADTYYFNYGDGNDTYNETLGNSTIDTILFGTGITFSMLSIHKISAYDVKIDIDGGAGGSIVIEQQLKVSSDVLDHLEFSDGSVVDLNTLDLTSIGTASADVLYGAKVGIGSTGVDTIYGMDGDDTIYGYRGGTYSYTAENYLYGGNGNDSIYGDRSNEELYGEAGDDYISGKLGDDLISGGLGSDTLIGGNGADTFVYEAGSTLSSIDTISDFDTSENDAIDISSLLSGYDELTDAITDFVQITDNGADSILSIDADGGADNFVQIATLTGVTGLTDEEALETSGNLIAA